MACLKSLLKISLAAFFLSGCSDPLWRDALEAFQTPDGSVSGTGSGASNIPYVLLISIDGYRADYTDRFKPPRLVQFRREGVSAESLVPVFPPDLFPAHYSIATGLHPEDHGIVSNYFYDPDRKEHFTKSKREKSQDGSWYSGAPLWVLAEQQGIPSAALFWPGSEAKIQGTRPGYFTLFDNSPAEDRVDQVKALLQLPAAKRPHLIFLVLSEIDTAGHQLGPDSPKMVGPILKVDRAIQRLFKHLDRLALPVNTVIVSPYGMERINESRVEFLEDYIDLSKATITGDSSKYSFFYEDKTELESALTTLKLKGKHFNIYRRDEIPARFHFSKSPRCGDLILITQSPYSVQLRREKNSSQKAYLGAHGYDPQITFSMRGIFYAAGPLFKNNQKIAPIEAISIYSLIAKLFNMKIPSGMRDDAATWQPHLNVSHE